MQESYMKAKGYADLQKDKEHESLQANCNIVEVQVP